ncbi:MAG TPA: AraC family transcriptional regulator [Longimicrobiales bacterium]|nr:AraC family transcriptional regulator [Longimicrobiales bacterium]
MEPTSPIYRLGGYREQALPAELARYVETAWVFSRTLTGPPIPGPGHRVLPEAAVSLAFECVRDDEGVVRDGRVVLIGPVVRPRFFAPGPGLHLEAVRIRPEWCIDLLGTHPGEHGNAITDVRSIATRAAADTLLDRLAQTRSSAAAIGVLVEWIGRRAAGAGAGTAALAHAALEQVRAAPGTTAEIDRVARGLGVSARHLRWAIRERTGLGPKRYHRLVRLGRAIMAADRHGARPPWSRLALRAGFYDQAHLIREFRALTGLTPAEAHLERAAQRTHV